METTRPQSIIDVIYSAESIKINEKKKPVNKQKCEKCGFMTSNKVCKACILLEGLNKSKPKIQMLITEWLVILVLKIITRRIRLSAQDILSAHGAMRVFLDPGCDALQVVRVWAR